MNIADSRLRVTTTAELLKAVELGIIDKTEARSLLGLPVKRGRMAKVQPRTEGRFAKSDSVLPFNRFAASAQEAMVAAQEAAAAAGRTAIETGDMLLAIASGEGPGAAILAALGRDAAKVKAALEAHPVPETSVAGLGPTGELKHAVERAFATVAYPGDIGTDHLLLALVGSGGGAGAALAGLGVTEEAIRGQLG
jgi:hypothetical protein